MNSFCLILFSILFLPKLNARLFTTGNVPDWKLAKSVKDSGKPLFLTQFVDGHIERGRKLSRVDSKDFLNVTSYSGFLTVDEEYHSNLWFWFFPAKGTEYLYDDDKGADDYDYEQYDYEEKIKYSDKELDKTPLILWLQGGPGASSLFGLFTECGPFFVTDDGINIEANEYSWHTKYSIIFIDNPVGTGFSFTDSPDGYASNVTQVSKQLYNGMVQFLKLFPWLQDVPLYIVGESFAGKYIPGIGYEIHEQNKESYFKINLQGLAMGNALSDPYNMLHYSDFAYQTGLVDMHGRNEMRIYEVFAKEYIFKPESKIVSFYFTMNKTIDIFNFFFLQYWDSLFYSFLRHSRYDNLYHILRPHTKLNLESYLDFINQDHVSFFCCFTVKLFSNIIFL